METTSHETARIHYSDRAGTRKIVVRDVGNELKEKIAEIEKRGGIVLRVSRSD